MNYLEYRMYVSKKSRDPEETFSKLWRYVEEKNMVYKQAIPAKTVIEVTAEKVENELHNNIISVCKAYAFKALIKVQRKVELKRRKHIITLVSYYLAEEIIDSYQQEIEGGQTYEDLKHITDDLHSFRDELHYGDTAEAIENKAISRDCYYDVEAAQNIFRKKSAQIPFELADKFYKEIVEKIKEDAKRLKQKEKEQKEKEDRSAKILKNLKVIDEISKVSDVIKNNLYMIEATTQIKDDIEALSQALELNAKNGYAEYLLCKKLVEVLADDFDAVKGIKDIKKRNDYIVYVAHEQAFLTFDNSGYSKLQEIENVTATQFLDMIYKHAKKGNISALVQIGKCFLNGKLLTQDFGIAFQFFNHCATFCHPEGMLELARMYEKGQGTPKSIKTAKEWYQLSAQCGNDEAKDALYKLEKDEQDRLFTTGIDGVRQIEKKNLEKREAANKLKTSINDLGKLLRDDPQNGYAEWMLCEKYKQLLKEKNYDKKLVTLFVDKMNDNPYICYTLCDCNLILQNNSLNKESYIFSEDLQHTKKRILKLAENGNISAMAKAAYWYIKPIQGITKQDLPKAFSYFKQAAFFYHPEGMIGLAYMYENGVYVQKKPKVAKEWLRLSGDCEKSLQQANGNDGDKQQNSSQNKLIAEHPPKEQKQSQSTYAEKQVSPPQKSSPKDLPVKNKEQQSHQDPVRRSAPLEQKSPLEIISESKQKKEQNIPPKNSPVSTVFSENINGSSLSYTNQEAEQIMWDETIKYINNNFIIESCYCIGASEKANRKIRSAMESYAQNITSDERPLFCYDATIFGSCDEGCLFTTKGVYIHNQSDKNVYFLRYEEIKNISIQGIIIKDVYFNDIELVSATMNDGKNMFCKLVEFLREISAFCKEGKFDSIPG